MHKYPFLLLLCLSFIYTACAQQAAKEAPVAAKKDTIIQQQPAATTSIITAGKDIASRFLPPSGFERTLIDTHSFAHYLRHLPLKVHGSQVLYYNGEAKANYGIYEAVIDLPIGKRDLHQCADAIMHLKAYYLWLQKRYDEIHFNFTNGFRADYSEWMKGRRIKVDGSRVYWVNRGQASTTYQDFWKYMEMVFAYAGTLSLEQELHSVNIENMQIGDIFIRGGSPGHAIIVVDMAQNPTTGEQLFMLAQSYMPAQELQLLSNPDAKNLSPWYSTKSLEILRTPEWTFEKSALKRF